MRVLLFFEGLLIGLIGRPVLWLIKFLRWPILLFGFFCNSISTYNPVTGQTNSEPTIIPFIVGIILFSIGITVKRYGYALREIRDWQSS